MSVDWGLAGAVVLTGLVLVFAILIVLICVLVLTGRIVGSTADKSVTSTGAASKPAPPVLSVPKPVAVVPAPKPVVQDGIEDETVAVIMSAVYTSLGGSTGDNGVSYAIQSIKRATGGRPVWGFAGMQQNTRPF